MVQIDGATMSEEITRWENYQIARSMGRHSLNLAWMIDLVRANICSETLAITATEVAGWQARLGWCAEYWAIRAAIWCSFPGNKPL